MLTVDCLPPLSGDESAEEISAMADQRKFIALDLGAETGRCVVGKLDGDRLILDEVYRFGTHAVRYQESLHWDILRIFDEILTGLARARDSYGPNFDGIGVDTWGVDYVLLDKQGRIIGYPYHYRDARTDGAMSKAFSIVSRDQLYERNGTQFAQFNTLFQLLSEKMMGSSFLNIADKVLLLPDFINRMLSGRTFSEYTIASTTGLIDPIKRDWAGDLIESFQLPTHLFPDIVEPGNILGRILPSIAERTGLSPGVPVIAIASHDTASAIVSIPVVDDANWAYLSSGTWSLMGIELDKPIISKAGMVHNFTNEGGAESTVRFLKNIGGLWPLQECRRNWLQDGKDYTYAYLSKLAAKEGPVKAWIDLTSSVLMKPGNMPARIDSMLRKVGREPKSGAGYMTRVILESLAFSYRYVKNEIKDVSGKEIRKLFAVGGGTQNDLLMQLTADAVEGTLIGGPVEGAVVGNIGIQALAIGEISNLRQWRQIVSNSFPLKAYEPIGTDYFAKNEEDYLAMCSRPSAAEDEESIDNLLD